MGTVLGQWSRIRMHGVAVSGPMPSGERSADGKQLSKRQADQRRKKVGDPYKYQRGWMKVFESLPSLG